MQARRTAEVEQYPWRHAAEVGYIVEHQQVLAEQFGLILLAPAAGPVLVAVLAVERLAAELRDEERLAGGNAPVDVGRVFRPRRIPAHVFVDGHHVKVRPKVVVHHELVFRFVEISKVEGGHEEARSVDVLARLQQLRQETVALWGVLRLVGDAPEAVGAAVAVAQDGFGEHLRSLRQSLLIGEVDGLPHGYLLPEHEAHALGLPHDVLVLLVMRQSYHVRSEVARFREKHHRVARRTGTAHALGYFLMERDAAKEHGLAVEQYLRALGFDVAEAYLVGHAVAVGRQLHAVKPRVVGRPAAQALDFELRMSLAFSVGSQRNVAFQLRQAYLYLPSGHRLRQLRVDMDKVCAVFVKTDEVIADVGFGQGDEHYVARYAAVVPPVERHRRYGVLLPAVVHLNNEQVVALFQLARNLELERSERAFMASYLLAVQVDVAAVAHSGEVKEVALAANGLRVEVAGVPNGALVVFQFGCLRVPIARHIEAQAVLKGVFIELFGLRGGLVFVDFHLSAGVVKVNDGRPLAVEQLVVAAVDVGDVVGRSPQPEGHQGKQ